MTKQGQDYKKGELLSKALNLMVNSHHGQFDRGGNPYALHPIAVMNIVNSNDEELQCICLLHDVIEDTDVTYKDLRELGFTNRVISAIDILTKKPGQTYEEYVDGVFTNVDAMKVKKGDLTHNSDFSRLKGIRDKDIERMGKYQVFYYKIQQKLIELGEQ